jgi:hypothetical protein
MSSFQAPAASTDASSQLDAPLHCGYAKLVGCEWEFVLRTTELELGRVMGAPRVNTLGISSAKNISRVHAEIKWNSDASEWSVTCKGKNGIHCNDAFHALDATFAVRHLDRLLIGDTIVYFLEPQ